MMEEGSPEYPQGALGEAWDQVGDSRQDPWKLDGGDPWNSATATSSLFPENAGARVFEPQFAVQRNDLLLPAEPVSGSGYPRTYAGGGGGNEHAHRDGPVQRFALDNPPIWDGKHPETQAEPYFKKLRGWLLTSRTLETQQGMQILSACSAGSDLELIVSELPLETLTREDGGRIVYEHIYNAYKEYIELTMTKRLEAALYSDQCRRS
jgi:hypothetical protein